MNETKLNIIPGQKVFLEPSRYYPETDRDPIEVTVDKVGRKYFSIKERLYLKYRISDGIEQNDNNYKGSISLTRQEIHDRKERIKLLLKLKNIFSAYGSLPYSLQTLQNIYELLNNDKTNKKL